MKFFKNKKSQFFAILIVVFTLIMLGVILGKLFGSESIYRDLNRAGDSALEINDAFGRLNNNNENLKRLLSISFDDTISTLSNNAGFKDIPCGNYRNANVISFKSPDNECATYENIKESFIKTLTNSLFERLSKEQKEIPKPKIENFEVTLSDISSNEPESFSELEFISLRSKEMISEPIRSTQFLKENSGLSDTITTITTTSSITTPDSLLNSLRPIPLELLCNKTDSECDSYYTKYTNFVGIEKLRRIAKFYNLELKSIVITPKNPEDDTHLACFSIFNSSGPLYTSNCNGLGCDPKIDLEIRYTNSYLPIINNILARNFPKKCILTKTNYLDSESKYIPYKSIDPLFTDNVYCLDIDLTNDEHAKKSINQYNTKVKELFENYFVNGYPSFPDPNDNPSSPGPNNYFEAYQFCVPLTEKPTALTNTLNLNEGMFSGAVYGYFGSYLSIPYQYFKRYNDLKSVVQNLIESDDTQSITSAISNTNPNDYEQFKIEDAKQFEKKLESQFYDFVDEFIKTIESVDLECINSNELIELYKKSSDLQKYDIRMNSTHFYIKISDPDSEPPEILSAPKLNGFRESVSPIVQLNYCKTDLLGDSSEDLSYEFVIDPEKDYDVIILSSTSNNKGRLNWYKISENTVCLSNQKFSEQSKLYLAEKYIKQFQSNTDDTDKNAQYDFLISLIKNLINIGSDTDENFCDYLDNRNFDVNEVFTECAQVNLDDEFKYFFSEFNFPEEGLNTGTMVVLDSGKDFFEKLDNLKKKECTLNQNWHSLVFIDTTYSFFKEVEIKQDDDNTIKQIELVNPIYFASFFTSNKKSSETEDSSGDTTNPISITIGGAGEGDQLTPE